MKKKKRIALALAAALMMVLLLAACSDKTIRLGVAGIGGVSMCALAEVLQGMGLVVQGSDMTDSDTVRHLRSVGIEVAIGHSAENLKSCDAVIRTAAIHDGNPEIAGAIARGTPRIRAGRRRGGGIMRGYRNALCVSGTHGKTTTTSMAAHIFMAAQKDPTVMIGGTLPLLHAGYRVGQGDTIILESCEYCNSFLNFFPTVAVILNVHADHLDFFKDLADIEHSFHRFAELVPAVTGKVVVNWDDEGARAAVEGLDRPMFTYSVKDRDTDCYADNVAFFDGYGEFDIIIRGQRYAHVALHVPGKHNVSNALAAAAAALSAGGGRQRRGGGACVLHRRGTAVRAQGRLSRGGGVRRLRPPSRRAGGPAQRGAAPAPTSG